MDYIEEVDYGDDEHPVSLEASIAKLEATVATLVANVADIATNQKTEIKLLQDVKTELTELRVTVLAQQVALAIPGKTGEPEASVRKTFTPSISNNRYFFPGNLNNENFAWRTL